MDKEKKPETNLDAVLANLTPAQRDEAIMTMFADPCTPWDWLKEKRED